MTYNLQVRGKGLSFKPKNLPLISILAMAVPMTEKMAAQQMSPNSECLAHDECNDSFFCKASSCADSIGAEYRCGKCHPCIECRCNTDAIDLACPTVACPDQPTDAIRFLQGPFLSRSPIPGAPTYSCLRRLLFDGGAFSDIQAAVPVEHPASVPSETNLSLVASSCPAISRTGILLGRFVQPEPSVPRFLLDVMVSSEGRPASLPRRIRRPRLPPPPPPPHAPPSSYRCTGRRGEAPRPMCCG
jgi:hypothetical protein